MASLPAVAEFMDHEVFTLHLEQDILEAIDQLIAHHVTGAPVVDDQRHVIGMLTEKDGLRLLTLGSGGDEPRGTVGQFMTREVVCIPSRMNIYYAAGLFLHHAFRRLPVVDDGRLVGAITRFDILRAVSANHKLVIGGDEPGT